MKYPTHNFHLLALSATSLILLLAMVPVVNANDRQVEPGKGVMLILEFDATSVSILAYDPIDRPSGTLQPKGVSLFRERAKQVQLESETIVLTFHDKSGRRAGDDAFVLRGRSLAFRDRILKNDSSERGFISGGPFSPARDQRVVRLPIPSDAAALLVVRESVATEVSTHVSREIQPLGLFLFEGVDLPDDFPPRLRLPAHIRGITVPISDQMISILEWSLEFPEAAVPSSLFQSAFHIVIMGDGFGHSDHVKFNERAQVVKKTLLGDGSTQYPGIYPYSDLTDDQIKIAHTPSGYRGIDFCPCDNFDQNNSLAVGNYQGADYAGFYGTSQLASIWVKASQRSGLAPWEIDAILVIANCELYGGAAYPESGLAFVSDEERFFKEELGYLAAHELGHVIAVLGDEYISCATEGLQPDGAVWWASDFPNIASQQDVNSGALPWQPDGPIPLLHCCPDCPASLGCLGCPNQTSVPGLSYGSDGRLVDAGDNSVGDLGLFWGAGFIYPEGPTPNCGCDFNPNQDPRGCGYYRPMEKCAMYEYLFLDFCDVCAKALKQAMQ